MGFDAEQVKNWNKGIVEEFRANQGRVGGPFVGVPMLILTTIGHKSRKPHETPLVYQPDGARMFIFGSKAGHPEHPAWYLNLVANPQVTVELGGEKFAARAAEITGAERDRIYARQAAAMPNFAEYQAATSRLIPVIALERV